MRKIKLKNIKFKNLIKKEIKNKNAIKVPLKNEVKKLWWSKYNSKQR